MNTVEIQRLSNSEWQPHDEDIQQWIDVALEDLNRDCEIVVRIVDVKESAHLNKQYRHKNGPTNILSFPVEVPEGVDCNILGDLVVCAGVLTREALEQHKFLKHHWAHIVIHGVLHLLGYDHQHEAQAEVMEAKEIELLKKLTIKNPYFKETDS